MSSDLVGIINLLLTILSFLIIGRALASWFDPGLRSPVGRILFDITEPIIGPIRQFVPRIGMFDLSPIIALILIRMLQTVLINALL